MPKVALELRHNPLLFPQLFLRCFARHAQRDLLMERLQQALLLLHLLLDAFGTLGEKSGGSADGRDVLLEHHPAEETAGELEEAVEDAVGYLHGGGEDNGYVLQGHLVHLLPFDNMTWVNKEKWWW